MKGKRISVWLLAVALALVAVVLASCGQRSGDQGNAGGTPAAPAAPAEEAATDRGSEGPGPAEMLKYATQPVGSSYYIVSTGQAHVLNKAAGIEVTVQPSAGSVMIPQLVGKGEVDLGISTAVTVAEGYTGTGDAAKFGAQPGLRVLLSGHESAFSVITHEKTGIKSINDIKGRRYTSTYPTMAVLTRLGHLVPKAYGLDVERDTISLKAENYQAAFKDLKEGRIDALFDGYAGPYTEELATKYKPVFLPIEPEKARQVAAELPGVYPGFTTKYKDLIPGGVPAVVTPTLLFATDQLSEDTAYRIVKTLLENQADLRAIHSHFVQWDKAHAVRELPVPYHPGAVKYYKEIGLWKD